MTIKEADEYIVHAETDFHVISLSDLHSEGGFHRHLFTNHRGEGEILQMLIKELVILKDDDVLLSYSACTCLVFFSQENKLIITP